MMHGARKISFYSFFLEIRDNNKRFLPCYFVKVGFFEALFGGKNQREMWSLQYRNIPIFSFKEIGNL